MKNCNFDRCWLAIPIVVTSLIALASVAQEDVYDTATITVNHNKANTVVDYTKPIEQSDVQELAGISVEGHKVKSIDETTAQADPNGAVATATPKDKHKVLLTNNEELAAGSYPVLFFGKYTPERTKEERIASIGQPGSSKPIDWHANGTLVIAPGNGDIVLVVESGATVIEDGAQTPERTDVCAAVKAEGDIVFRAVLHSEDTASVIWTGGEPIAGEPLKRKVSRSEWAKHTVTATRDPGGEAYTILAYVIGAEHTGFSPSPGQMNGNHFEDNDKGYPNFGTGLFGPDGPSVISRCEIQFTVRPDQFISDGNDGVFNKEKVQWDVTRKKRRKWWKRESGQWTLAVTTSGSWEDDDGPPTLDGEEDLNPWKDGTGHLYGNDQISVNAGIGSDGRIAKWNMREWVRVGFGGAPGRNGEACSDYFDWRCFRAFHQVDGDWVTLGEYENEIVAGHDFWGTEPEGSLQITTGSLAAAEIGLDYSIQLEAQGGNEPYTWSLDDGAMPAGLGLSEEGVIAGTPTTSGQYQIVVEVQSTEGTLTQADLQVFTLIVNE